MAGDPVESLVGKTPLQTALTPNLDFLANQGEYGCLKFSSEGLSPTGDALHLALLGYDPKKYLTGPGAFAAVESEVVLEKQDVAYLCALVTLGSQAGRGDRKKFGTYLLLEDDPTERLEVEEARELIDAINEQLGSETLQFYAGDRHRHIMVWVNGVAKVTCYDPHTLLGQEVGPYLPSGERADVLKEVMEASHWILRDHSVNQEREERGLKPANALWLWGPGKSVELPPLKDRCGLSGAVVSNADIHLGIGMCAGLKPVTPDQDMGFDNNLFDWYADMAFKLLQQYDFVYLHLQEKPEFKRLPGKEQVSRLEQLDQYLVGPLLKKLSTFERYRGLIVCNHYGSSASQHGSMSPVFALCESENMKSNETRVGFNEMEAGSSSTGTKDPLRLANRLLVQH